VAALVTTAFVISAYVVSAAMKGLGDVVKT
jgi:hypothetical protein